MTSHGPLPPPPRPVAHCARPTHCAAIDSALRALHSAYQRLDTKRGTERTTRSDKYAHIRGATTRTAGSGHAAERHTPDTSLPHTHSVRAEAWASESSNHTAPLRVVTSEDLKHAATHTIHTHGKLTHHTIRRNTMRTFIGLDRVGCGSSP